MAVKESSQIAAQREFSHAVKLFGMKISLSVTPMDEDQAASQAELAKSEDGQASIVEDFSSFSASTSSSEDEHKVPCFEKSEQEASLPKQQQQNEHQDKSSGRPLKRPDKPVACPRCNSLDTKFCYFNNYNVNQPRHFCKNCQRYWTAGGTLRNVPVGAGRRKNKSGRVEGLVGPRGESHEASDKKMGKVQQTSGCIISKVSVGGGEKSVRTIGAAQMQGCTTCSEDASAQHSFSSTSEGSNDSRDDSTCGSSVSNPAQEYRDGNYATTTTSAASGWSYGFLNPDTVRSSWQGFPWPGQMWSPAAGWNAAWNTPWSSLAATAASAAAKAIASNVGSLQSTLGKHLREETEKNNNSDGNLNNSNRCGGNRFERGPLWAPKTLRIDAPQGGDVCRSSSFLADLGASNKKLDTISTGGMFKAFQQDAGAGATTTVAPAPAPAVNNPAKFCSDKEASNAVNDTDRNGIDGAELNRGTNY